jgi:hypothetical protein
VVHLVTLTTTDLVAKDFALAQDLHQEDHLRAVLQLQQVVVVVVLGDELVPPS